jgi:hypothetical protein
MICIAMYYLEAILQSIISTIVFVCVRANNRSELLYRSQTTLQQEDTASAEKSDESLPPREVVVVTGRNESLRFLALGKNVEAHCMVIRGESCLGCAIQTCRSENFDAVIM